jgi:uncharacterized protein YjbI with pentapeptide repeats
MLFKMRIKRISKGFWWIIWEFLGIHYVIQKFKALTPEQEQEKKPPVTAGLWIIGIYVALFGLASQQYQSKTSIIENRINNIISSLSTPGFKQGINRIPSTQKMLCPVAPELLKPWETILSLLGPKSTYKEGVLLLQRTIENWKDSLSNVNLSDADLSKTNLSGAVFIGADLNEANLRGSHLDSANFNETRLFGTDFKKAILLQAKFKGATLFGTDLREANLGIAIFRGAKLFLVRLDGANLSDADLSETIIDSTDLSDVDLRGADLSGTHFSKSVLKGAHLNGANLKETIFDSTDLRGADLSGTNLSKVKSFYMSKLDTIILNQIKIKWPDKLSNNNQPEHIKKTYWQIW